MAVLAKYLRMLAAPVGQSLDHAYTVYGSPLSLPVMLGAALHLGLMGHGLWLW